MRARRAAPWLLAGTGLVLAVGLAAIAEPARIFSLARSAHPPDIAAALAATVAMMAFRGARLSLLTGSLPPGRSTAVISLSQLATAVLPWRLGELALLPLLRASGVEGTVRGLSILIVIRLLDLLTLLAVAATAAGGAGGHAGLALIGLVVVAMGSLVAWRGGGGWLRTAAPRLRHRLGWRRRLLRDALRARRELRAAARSPARLAGAFACSFGVWASLWVQTIFLLRGMGIGWSAVTVLLAVVGAALASTLPVNAVGTFGSAEVGWTAAVAPFGISARDALAAGFASHVWSFLLMVVTGVVAAAFLAISGRPGRSAGNAER